MGRRKKEEEEVYHVEVITKARVSEDSDWEYLVKWAGYDSDADSWEPQANVQQCDRLLASFWKHIGMDEEDYPIGYEVAAGEDWINKEKQYFTETFVKSSKQKSNKGTNKTGRQERRKSKSRSEPSTPPASESAEDSEVSDEVPLANTSTIKKLKQKTRVPGTESEPESDGPVRKQVKTASHPKAITPPKQVPKGQAKRSELSSAAGSSSIVPPKTPVARTHQDQRTNPLVKSMGLPPKSVEAGSSLSTKQRIAAGIPPPPTGPKPLPPAPKKSLPSLSFKKNKPPVPPSTQTNDTTTSATFVATSTSPVQPSIVTNDTDLVASPQPMDIDEPADLFGPLLDNPESPAGSPGNVMVFIPPKSQEEIDAEQFLQTIHIPAFSGPLDAAETFDQTDQLTTELNKTLSMSKIPKKWKWSGDLFISTSESKTELLCAITIADPSGISNSPHINLLLSPRDSLRISKLYPIMDLSPLLRACGKPQYFGTLESSEPSEEMIIHGLENHMTCEGLAAAIPLFYDDTEVAILIVFPGAQQGLTKVLEVPEHLCSGTPLLVVLLPFSVSVKTSTDVAGWRSIKDVLLFNPQDVLTSHELPQEAVLYQAMSLLHFPKTLLDFLNNSATRRAYCIWPSPDQLSPGLDTAMLQCILNSTRAVPARLEEDVRVVFISSRHLDIVHTMPSLINKRANSPEIQFWMYGHSASVVNERWKVQEIYPLGGVVTFTASALAEDLVGCHHLISQIIEHPLWDCHIIPEVLAVSHLLCSGGNHSVPSKSCLDPILNLVDLGLISAIRMPNKGYSGEVAWLSQVFSHSSASEHELLENYLGILKSHPSTLDMKAEQLITFTNNEVIKDLSNVQIQPTFMENYRRFVVIRAASEGSIPFDKDGLEWSPLSLFSFKDDYFQP